MRRNWIAYTVLILAMLMSLFTMGPAADKADKLKVNDQDWDREGQQFVIEMSCKWGIATAGEHAGFKAVTTLVIEAGGKTYTEKGETGIAKADGADKDADGYVGIQPTYIKWDREGFEGTAKVETSIQLLNPSGNVMGDAVTSADDVKIEPPGEIPGDDDSPE